MSETLLTVVGALVLIGGPFLLLWFLGRRRQAQAGQPASPGGRLLRLLGIVAVGVVVIVGVFYSCTWVMAAQPTVGNLNLATVVVVVVIVVFVAVIIMRYVRLFAEVISFFSRMFGRS